VVYSLFSYHQKNLGDPGSSRGTLEHIRVDLTVFISADFELSGRIFGLLATLHNVILRVETKMLFSFPPNFLWKSP
jgi:hypothetical protein